MLNITGIGNSKVMFQNIFSDLGVSNQLVDYNDFINNHYTGIVFYDGLMFDLGMNLVKQCKNSIIVFIDPKSVFVSGSSIASPKNNDNYICGECSLRSMKNQLFKLSLFDTLFHRTDYKVVGEEFTMEFRHLASILKDKLFSNEIFALEYNLHTSLYKEIEISGLTKCKSCDNNYYSQDKLQDELSYLFKEGIDNDI